MKLLLRDGTIKILGTLIALLAVIGIGIAWWLHHNAGALLREALQSYGSQMTGASVKIGSVSLSPGSGLGEIHDLVIGNPSGFLTAHAIKVERIAIEVAPLTLAQKRIHVRRITVIAPDVIYEQGAKQTNFDALMKNISHSLGPSSEDGKPAKRLTVDAFDMTNATAAASTYLVPGKAVGITLPDIHLKDIGKEKDGVTPSELGQIIADTMKRKLSGAHHFGQAISATGDTLGKAGSAIKNLFK